MAIINTGFVLNPKVSAFNQVRQIFLIWLYKEQNKKFWLSA
ncbi:MAG: hypothetical protein ACJA2M_003071 [Polaribacter sp.]|jgi:hypothetical protein